MEILQTKIKNANSISLRSDGSVDRINVDMIYTLAKLIDKVGNTSLIFSGVGEPFERGSLGIFNTIIKSMEYLLGSNLTNLIMKDDSSLVTDGTSVNTRHNNGLWKTFQACRLKKFSEPVAPLITIWYYAHKPSLAWKAANNEIPEIKNMLMTLNGISSYFAKSGVIFRELKNNLIVCSFPNIFEIRWNEFTHQLVESILKSWNVLIIYVNSTICNEARRFSTYLCNENNLHLLCFMADVLIVLSRYQQ